MENVIDETKETTVTDEGQVEDIKMTKEEYEKALNSEADKRVSQALKTSQAKWETEFKEKLEIERAEAEKLAKLSESDKQKVIFERQQNELEESKRSFQNERVKFEAVKIMTDKQVPISFIDILVSKDAETTYANIDNFKTNFDLAVQKAVEERFKGGGREVNNSTNTKQSGVNPWKSETFNLTKQGEILKQNPELAKSLMNNAK